LNPQPSSRELYIELRALVELAGIEPASSALRFGSKLTRNHCSPDLTQV
jgi:hypothetical protein